MSDNSKPISPLRQRMIDDMTARRFKEKVQKDYVRHVRTFAAFLGRLPDTATSEDLRRRLPPLAQQFEQSRRQHHGAIPLPFALLDPEGNGGVDRPGADLLLPRIRSLFK